MAKCDKQRRKFENYRRDYFRGKGRGGSSKSKEQETKSTKETSGADGIQYN